MSQQQITKYYANRRQNIEDKYILGLKTNNSKSYLFSSIMQYNLDWKVCVILFKVNPKLLKARLKLDYIIDYYIQIQNLQNAKMQQYRMNSKYDYSFKFILVGDTGVGKTSLISRFIEGKFDVNHEFTIGVQYGSKNIMIANKIIKLQIWDTAGQQQFKAITRSYYRSSAAALVVFDLTRKQTFRNITRWVEDVKNNSNKDVVLVLIGNKTDMVNQRMVSRNQALKLARDYQMLYMETSAKNLENVERAFVWPATNILDKVEGGFIKINRQDQAIKVNTQGQKKVNNQSDCEC